MDPTTLSVLLYAILIAIALLAVAKVVLALFEGVTEGAMDARRGVWCALQAVVAAMLLVIAFRP